MEKKTIGKFISALRKANGMTQKELGEKLFVSDKTVSRWECDECTPELSLIPSIERERFDDPDKFIEYMQNDYDTWYEEGYGDSPAPPHNELGYPNKKWAEIDGKEYYFCAHLYKSIDILQHLNGAWEIIVTTDEADQNGQAMYSILSAGLLSLHVINLAVCVIWYLVKTKKHQTA